jgi:hypothetical protein
MRSDGKPEVTKNQSVARQSSGRLRGSSWGLYRIETGCAAVAHRLANPAIFCRLGGVTSKKSLQESSAISIGGCALAQ